MNQNKYFLHLFLDTWKQNITLTELAQSIVCKGQRVLFLHSVAVPHATDAVNLALTENNAINVTCIAVKRFNGPAKNYIAYLRYGDAQPLVKNETKCAFEFKDLSYSTFYEVEVCRILIFCVPVFIPYILWNVIFPDQQTFYLFRFILLTDTYIACPGWTASRLPVCTANTHFYVLHG